MAAIPGRWVPLVNQSIPPSWEDLVIAVQRPAALGVQVSAGSIPRAWVELDLRPTATERTILTITQFVYNMVSMVTPQEYAIVSARISPEIVFVSYQ